jgi:hypothetical protein
MVLGKLLGTILTACTFAPTAVLAQTAPTPVVRLTECRPGAPEAATSSQLRATPTARCGYDLAALYRRLGRVLAHADGRGFNATSAALTFGVPAMTTQHDSDHAASYQVLMDGKGGWTMRLWVREMAYPFDGKPPAFTPGRHPQRLMEIDALNVRYDISIAPPPGTVPGHCLTVANARAILKRAGWADTTTLANLSGRGGGVASPTFKSTRGSTTILRMPSYDHIATETEQAAECVTEVTIMQSPLADNHG